MLWCIIIRHANDSRFVLRQVTMFHFVLFTKQNAIFASSSGSSNFNCLSASHHGGIKRPILGVLKSLKMIQVCLMWRSAPCKKVVYHKVVQAGRCKCDQNAIRWGLVNLDFWFELRFCITYNFKRVRIKPKNLILT